MLPTWLTHLHQIGPPHRGTHVMGDILLGVTNHVRDVLGQSLQIHHRAHVMGQGSTPGTVMVRTPEGSVYEVAVYLNYTSSKINDPGGPQVGHEILVMESSPGQRVVVNKVNY